MADRTPSPARLREIAEHVRSLGAHTQAEEVALAAGETEQAVHRVCEEMTGKCVMFHEVAEIGPCTRANCAVYRAAFNAGDRNG